MITYFDGDLDQNCSCCWIHDTYYPSMMGIVMLLYEFEYCMWFQVLLLIKVYYISNDCAVVEFSGI